MLQRKKNKRRIDPGFLDTQFFQELGYEEVDQVYDKVIEMFEKKSYKQFYKPDIVRLMQLVGNECSAEAEALHDMKWSNIYYRKVQKVSELGLQLDKKNKELLHNLRFAKRVLEERKQN